MRIPAAPYSRRSRFFHADDAPFMADSDLQGTIRRMISTNSLAAFTTQVANTRPAPPVRGVSPGVGDPVAAEPVQAQRTLEAVPATPPAKPLPRGSLLDLRV
jgi:hypothetical protein